MLILQYKESLLLIDLVVAFVLLYLCLHIAVLFVLLAFLGEYRFITRLRDN